MIRKLALILCASLLALCLAACTVSYTTWGQANLQPTTAPAFRGVVTFKYASRNYRLRMGVVDGQVDLTAVCTSPGGIISGMRFDCLDWEKRVRIPLWPVCTLLAAALTGLVYIGRWSRMRRLRNACCIECGYSLTGNVSGVCPECATAVPMAGMKDHAHVQP